MVQRLDEFVQIEIGGFRLFLSFGECVVLEVSDSIEECDLVRMGCTPLWLLRLDREF